MSDSSCDSISNSIMMTCFCGELTRCFTPRTPLNLVRRFYRCSKSKIENCEFWRWEDKSSENSSIEANLLMSKLEVATLKMENLRESLNAVKIERDNLKKKLENLESLNYFEVNKLRNLKAKVPKLKM
uniref:GRF-type domain-containing protein n=1 Tax=Solanum lycopersicum TaxID=4081 RepID=A0A3Q7JC10_SOLLC